MSFIITDLRHHNLCYLLRSSEGEKSESQRGPYRKCLYLLPYRHVSLDTSPIDTITYSGIMFHVGFVLDVRQKLTRWTGFELMLFYVHDIIRTCVRFCVYVRANNVAFVNNLYSNAKVSLWNLMWNLLIVIRSLRHIIQSVFGIRSTTFNYVFDWQHLFLSNDAYFID